MTSPTVVNPVARFEPSLAITSDGIFVGWREFSASDLDECFFQKFLWDGAALTEDEAWPLPHDPVYQAGDQRRAALAGGGALIWAAWNDLQVGLKPKHGNVRVSLMPTPIVRGGAE